MLLEASGIAASVNPPALTPHRKAHGVTESQHAKRRMRTLARSRAPRSPYASTRSAATRSSGTSSSGTRSSGTHSSSTRSAGTRYSATSRRHRYYERFHTSSFASDITDGDVTAGEDPVVRQAAIDALGNMNGTVVAIEPTSGRVLAMVNQRLALSSGAQPCSTIKLSVALAALSEGVIDEQTEVSLGSRSRMNLTEALAHSNNAYFEAVGRKLGFEKVQYYAHQFGLGELAGYHIPGEQLGTYPETEIPAKLGGVSKMCSFGEGISMTPLQLGALVTAISNGGTLYYLKYPRTEAEGESFKPEIKRSLELAPNGIDDIKVGMRGAVDFGTARRAAYDPSEAVFGKTGTCTDYHAGATFMGWFGSFTDAGPHQVVVVVMLTSPRHNVSGGLASSVAGAFYRNLAAQQYFASDAPRRDGMPEILVTKSCCSR